MGTRLRSNSTFLYDDVSGDIVGVRDPDGSEFLWARAPRLGVFFDTTDQSDGVGGVTPMTFNTNPISRGVTVVDGSKIRVDRAGIYNWHLSVQIQNADSQDHSFDLWGVKNGETIPFSNFSYSVPSSHGGVPGRLVPSQNFWLELNAGDYVQIMWSSDSAQVSIQYTPVQTSPTRPATPSLLLTVQEIAMPT